MKLSKNSFYKSWAPKLIFSNEIFFQTHFCDQWGISFSLKSFYLIPLTWSKYYICDLFYAVSIWLFLLVFYIYLHTLHNQYTANISNTVFLCGPVSNLRKLHIGHLIAAPTSAQSVFLYIPILDLLQYMAKTSQCTAFQFVPNSTIYICSVCKYEESNQ